MRKRTAFFVVRSSPEKGIRHTFQMTKGTYLCDIYASALYHGKCSRFRGGCLTSVWRKQPEHMAEATRACGGSHQSVWRKPHERMASAAEDQSSATKTAAALKRCSRISSYCFIQIWLLRKRDCFVGANRSASTALCAEIGVDRILLAFGDCANRALINTCTASNAVVTNYVCHNFRF